MKKTRYNGTIKQGWEGCVLKKLVEAVLENLSTKQAFRFRVVCGCCYNSYGNQAIKFSKADESCIPWNKQIIYDALYEQEFREAKLIAISNAAENMNYCPICKGLVCNDCFFICEELDMCKNCASDLAQQGNPVSVSYLDRNPLKE